MKNPETKLFLAWIAFALLLILGSMCFSGCEVFKHKRSVAVDSTAVARVDSGSHSLIERASVSSEIGSSTEDWEWWRTTTRYYPGWDTGRTVNNYTTTPQPSVVIVEGGKGRNESSHQSYDSSWQSQLTEFWSRRFDSLALIMRDSSKGKHVETKGLGLFAVILIALAVAMLLKGLGSLWGFASKYKIVRKQ